MKTGDTFCPTNVSSFGTLSELLDLLFKLSRLNEPLNTPGGLRSAVELLLRLSSLIGLDSDYVAWLRAVLDKPAVFNLVLAVVNYLLSAIEPAHPTFSANDRTQNVSTTSTTQAIPIAVWLSLIAELAQLLQKLRAKQ